MRPRVLLEIAVETADDARAAVAAGADRLELCAALSCGGLTPSRGAIEAAARAAAAPLIVLIRPRAGDFCYSAGEFDAMRSDVEAARAAGAAGVALGVLTARGEIDALRCRALVDCAAGLQTVFHRAFDVTPDPPASLDCLVELGFARVLSSGGATSARDGAAALAALAAQARGRIEIMPGGGIRAANVAEVLRRTGCGQVHAGCRRIVRSEGGRRAVFGFGASTDDDGSYGATDVEAVAALRAAADRAG